MRAKLCDSLLYHVHYNSIKTGSLRLQPVPTDQSSGCKALTALLETSITDGLKSRLTQYLKHVVEDDVLFTNSNPLHTPPFWLNIVLDVPKLKITQTHIPHTYTSQIIFFVLCTFSVRVNNPWPNAICFVLKVQNCHLVSLIVLVLQWMLKWSKRVSLWSVSFTNYPTLHHPLLSTFLFLFLFFFFFFYMFTNFTHHQILHYTKDTKSNTYKISVTQLDTNDTQ